MHIPDGMLAPGVAAATGVVAAGGLAYSLRAVRHRLRDRTTVLMGTLSAFVFAAQMVNIPLGPLGVTGHLMGGVLAAVMVGPWAGATVIAAVLLVQCLIFQDGGLTALGANFLNIGLIGTVGGYAIYAPIRRAIGGRQGILIGAMIAAWFSVLLAAGAIAVELAASGRLTDFFTILGWMALVHAGIGLIEAVITGLVLRFVLLTRPDLIDAIEPAAVSTVRRWGQVTLAGLAIALAVAVFLAPFASSYPDGLEWVGERLGFLVEERLPEPVVPAPMPDYGLELEGWTHLGKAATAIAGLVGTLIVFGIGIGLARIFARPTPPGNGGRASSPAEGMAPDAA